MKSDLPTLVRIVLFVHLKQLKYARNGEEGRFNIIKLNLKKKDPRIQKTKKYNSLRKPRLKPLNSRFTRIGRVTDPK